MVRISIIIVTYNSKKYIDNCLKSLYEYNDIGDELEVIIVDNSPKDINNEMFSYIKETYKYPIKLIHNEKNGGYGQGNNIGIEAASGDIIAIMNPDIIHTESLFKQVISEFKNNNKLGMLGYKQLGGKEISFYIRQEFQKPIVTTLLTKLYNKINYFSKDRMYLSGAYFFTLKNNFKKIDLFDENIFLYCEESDITQRFLKNNFDIKYDYNKSYIHDIDGRDDTSINTLLWLLDSTKYYCNKYGFSFENFSINYIKELSFKSKVLRLLGKNVDSIEKQIKYLKNYE